MPTARIDAAALRDEPKWRTLFVKSAVIWGFPIRTILLASAYSMLASAACAQYAAPGGFAPFAIDAQGAAAASAAANAGANDPNNGRCYTESRGRGGQQYLCDDQPSPPPPKK